MSKALRIAHRALLALAVLSVAWAQPASAHAWLLEGHPGPNQHVTEAPKVLFLRFTENVEREHTGAQVYDLNRTRVDAGDVRFGADRRDEILVPLQSLADGIYTVRWFTLSVDTHTASGSYLFAVGNASLTGAAPVTGADHPGHEHVQGASLWSEAASRAAYYAGLLLAFGIPVAYVALNPRTAETPLRSRTSGRLAAIGVAAAALATVGALAVVGHFAGRVSLSWFEAAAGTRTGRLLSLRFLAMLGAMMCFTGAWRTHGGRVRHGLLLSAAGLSLAGLVATSFSSHAASVKEQATLSVAVDLAHLLAGSVWTGGLVTLFVLVRRAGPTEAGHLVTRFSPLAISAVGVLVATGVYAGLQHLRAWSDLWTSPYGGAVLVKASLLVPLVALGAVNKFWVGPRLLGRRLAPRALRRTVAAEMAILCGILVAAGVLATSAPPTPSEVAGGPQPLTFEKSFKTTHLVFAITPNPPTRGLQNFTVFLHPFGAQGIPNGTQVYLKFAAPGQPEPDSPVVLTREGPNSWGAQGGYFTERGLWTTYVIMQRPDEFAKVAFEVNVQ